jgi:hypothetical protein
MPKIVYMQEMRSRHRICKLTEKIWKREIFPCHSEEGLICPFYEKGDRVKCENYYGIPLLNMAYKVFSVAKFETVQPTVETTAVNYQCGFRLLSSDHLHSIREILEKL